MDGSFLRFYVIASGEKMSTTRRHRNRASYPSRGAAGIVIHRVRKACRDGAIRLGIVRWRASQ